MSSRQLRSIPVLALLALAIAPAATHAQVARERLFHSDTIEVANPVLSPDGRWLVYGRSDALNKASLWIQPARGGEPRRLTSPGYYDALPRWLPSGDGLVFRSTRPVRGGDRGMYAMTIRIDPGTGAAVGTPRQVTADAVGFAMQPSPDGEWLAYQYGPDNRKLKTVPTAGGSARELASFPGALRAVAWAPDGRSLYVTTAASVTGGGPGLFRVPAAGGEPTRVAMPSGKVGYVVSPNGRYAAATVDGPGQRDRTIEILAVGGDVVKRIPANSNTRPVGWSRDGRSLIALESNVVAPTRVVPVTGGRPRDLTPGNAYDWVMAFSRDNKAVYTWTEKGDSGVVARVPLNGGARTDFVQTRDASYEAVTGDYIFRVLRPEGARRNILEAISLRDRSRHRVTDSLAARDPLIAGPGGAWAEGDEIVYMVREGDRFEVHAWAAPGRTRLIRAFQGQRPITLAVHGSRTAWVQPRGDSADILVADGQDRKPRRLYTLGRDAGTDNELAFSHDGRMLALHGSSSDRQQDPMVIVDVTGRTPARVLDTGMSYWYWPRWLPDNSAIAVIAGGVGDESHVLLVPLAPGARPVNITRQDPSPKWGFELSPDGRWVAYPGEVWKGSTVWRIDVLD